MSISGVFSNMFSPRDATRKGVVLRFAKILIVLLIIVFGVSLLIDNVFAKNNFKQPRFVKEWEIKEIKPGIPVYVVSMTSNKNGLFVLLKYNDIRYGKFEVKKSSQMTEKEVEDFFDLYIWTNLLSMTQKTLNMTKDEKAIFIDFFVSKLLTYEDAGKMPESDQDELIKYYLALLERGKISFRDYHKNMLKNEGKTKYINHLINRLKISCQYEEPVFVIQHYDLDGNLLRQWPENNKLNPADNVKTGMDYYKVLHFIGPKNSICEERDSRDYLVKPLSIDSDKDGNLYVADYDGDKIVKFDGNGNVLKLWMIDPTGNEHEFLSQNRGFCIKDNTLYVVTKREKLPAGAIPVLWKYDLDGTLLETKELPVPRVPASTGEIFGGQKIPLLKADGNVTDVAVDSLGHTYFLEGHANKNWQVEEFDGKLKKKYKYEPILRNGFDTDVKVTNQKTGKKEKYSKYVARWTGLFSSQDRSGTTVNAGLYTLDKIGISPRGEIFTTFIGQKPFGTVNALVYDKDGKMVGYWKDWSKSYSGWFNGLNELEKIRSRDRAFEMAFQGSTIFVGRTIDYDSNPDIEVLPFGGNMHSVIQRFEN